MMRRPASPSRERRLMADLKRHEGTWEGRYLHVDADGAMLDRHASRVVCAFPRSGPYAYRQQNRFTWEDGRTEEADIGGVLDGGRLRFDTETFSGEAWSRRGVVFLDTVRKDAPGLSFREVILLGAGGLHRTRTWHWFEEGRCVRRTLCDERMV